MDVTTNLTKILRIIREHYKQLYANKLGSLQDMDKFPETHELPKLTQEKIETLSRPVIDKEMESE